MTADEQYSSSAVSFGEGEPMLAELSFHSYIHLFNHLFVLTRHSANRLYSGAGLSVALAGHTASRGLSARPITVVDFDSRYGERCVASLRELNYHAMFARSDAELMGTLDASPWLAIYAGGTESGRLGALLDSVRHHIYDIPVLVFGESGNHETDALLQGADDYVTIPISPERLRARLIALQRRYPATFGSMSGLRADPHSRRAWIGKSELNLPPLLFSLLMEFVRHPGRVLSGQHLANAAGAHAATQPHAVKVHVHKLRSILAPHGMDDVIHTVRHFGYRYDPPVTTRRRQ